MCIAGTDEQTLFLKKFVNVLPEQQAELWRTSDMQSIQTGYAADAAMAE